MLPSNDNYKSHEDAVIRKIRDVFGFNSKPDQQQGDCDKWVDAMAIVTGWQPLDIVLANDVYGAENNADRYNYIEICS